MLQGDDNKAILNYNEVASIFSEKKGKIKISEEAKNIEAT